MNVLDGREDIAVTKTDIPAQGRRSLVVEHQSLQKSQPKVGTSVVTHVRRLILSGLTSRNYRPITIAEGSRESEQDMYSGNQPLCPLFTSTLRLI